MCGIAGIFHLDKKPVDQKVLERMNNTIVHRGPDGHGYYIDRFAGLAHRRLSIIDLEGGKQPLSNEDGSVWISFNGEIYNFDHLKKRLAQKGHKFTTHSDTEVIVHLYEQYAEKSLDFLQGMFAFAIWDKKKEKLFIARDRIGIKPVYYFFDGKKFLFGSEIKTILAYGNIPQDIDYTAINDYLTYSFITSPKSIFKHIRKLDAAHYLSIDTRNPEPEIKEYWDISFADKINCCEQSYTEQILSQLQSSVSDYLVSDVPLGGFLSGGIDSSAVVAMMAKSMNEPVKTCSIGFDSQKFSELPYAKIVADLYNTDHTEYIVRPQPEEFLHKLLFHYDEPFADSSALPTYYLCEQTRRKVTVALSGDGGDENFAGYRRYIFDALENRIRNAIPSFIGNPLFSMLGYLYPKADWLPQVLRAKTLFQNLAKKPFDAYFHTVSLYSDYFLDSICTPDFKSLLNGYHSSSVTKKYYEKADSDHYLDKVLYTEIKTLLPDDYLVKVDRASMAHALEVRVPLLDHKFMEFTAKIPANIKLKGFTTKYILKKALESHLPDSILYRKKMGFEIPIDTWMRNDLKQYVAQVLFSKNSFVSNIIKTEFLRQIWDQHQKGLRNYGSNLWLVFLLESWYQKYINNK